eukprot:gene19764-20235_t
MRFLLGFLACLMLGGCASTAIQGYADPVPPAAPAASPAALVVAPPDLAVDTLASLVAEGGRRGLTVVDAQVLLPPTRTYSDAEIRKTLGNAKIASLLIVTIGYTSTHKEYAGTMLSAGFNADGGEDGKTRLTFANSAWAGAGRHHELQKTNFSARLIEVASGRALWVGNGQVTAQSGSDLGALADQISAKSAVAAIFKDMRAKGVIGGA